MTYGVLYVQEVLSSFILSVYYVNIFISDGPTHGFWPASGRAPINTLYKNSTMVKIQTFNLDLMQIKKMKIMNLSMNIRKNISVKNRTMLFYNWVCLMMADTAFQYIYHIFLVLFFVREHQYHYNV